MTGFTQFERWCLCLPVPALALPALVDPTELELAHRAVDISYDLCPRNEKELAQTLIQCGTLDYLSDPLHAPVRESEE
jgi:hypothetical protein